MEKYLNKKSIYFGLGINKIFGCFKYLSFRNIRLFMDYAKRKGFKHALLYVGSYLNKQVSSNKLCLRIDFSLVDLSPENQYPKINLPVSKVPLIVSIIIPVYNNWGYTYNCLAALTTACTKYSFEVILADDGSTDETADMGNIVKNIRVIKDGKNRGFVLNCNKAAKSAKGKYIYLLNNDTKCLPESIDRLVEVLEQNEKVGIVGSKLIYPSGSLQEAGGIVWNDGSAWNYGHLQDPELPEYCYRRETDYVSGASLMIRKDLWDKIGGFDIRFTPAYCEDTDLCFSVRSLGYSVVFQPESLVIHYEGISNGKDIKSGIKQYQVKNNALFVQKWQDILSKQHSPNGTNLFVARDRSTERKSVLIIDHYVPQYDRDAGSRTIWAFIKTMVDLGYSVKFIGDNFYCSQPYTSELQRMGVEVLYGVWYMKHWEKWLKENGNFLDAVVLSRPYVAKNYIKTLRKYTNAKLIYYCHDLHFLREERRLQVPGERPGHLSVKKIRDEELGVIHSVDTTLHCSNEEIDIIRKGLPGADIRYIQPCLFNLLDKHNFNPEKRRGFLFVGGFGHTPNIDAAKWFVNEVFPLIKEKLPDAILYIVGSNPTDAVKALVRPGVELHSDVDDATLNSFYESARCAVIPLRYGAGIKVKVIEAMAHGLPVITTASGVEGLPEEMKTITIVSDNNKNSMLTAIFSVYEDYPKLRRLSSLGLEAVQRQFSYANMCNYWKDLMN